MKYQKILNLSDNTPKQLTKFRTKHWAGMNDDTRGTYDTNSQIKFKISMLKSSLCDYGDACKLVSGTIIVTELAASGGNNGIEVVLRIVLHLLIT